MDESSSIKNGAISYNRALSTLCEESITILYLRVEVFEASSSVVVSDLSGVKRISASDNEGILTSPDEVRLQELHPGNTAMFLRPLSMWLPKASTEGRSILTPIRELKRDEGVSSVRAEVRSWLIASPRIGRPNKADAVKTGMSKMLLDELNCMTECKCFDPGVPKNVRYESYWHIDMLNCCFESLQELFWCAKS